MKRLAHYRLRKARTLMSKRCATFWNVWKTIFRSLNFHITKFSVSFFKLNFWQKKLTGKKIIRSKFIHIFFKYFPDDSMHFFVENFLHIFESSKTHTNFFPPRPRNLKRKLCCFRTLRIFWEIFSIASVEGREGLIIYIEEEVAY